MLTCLLQLQFTILLVDNVICRSSHHGRSHHINHLRVSAKVVPDNLRRSLRTRDIGRVTRDRVVTALTDTVGSTYLLSDLHLRFRRLLT